MRGDIQEALLSVAEVAVFAWSLLELLLTRILPLAGLLAGHLLLQFGRHLVGIIIPAAGRRETRAENSCDVQAEELVEDLEEDYVLPPVGKKDGDHCNHDLESVIKNDGKLVEERQGQQLLLPSLTQDEPTTTDAELLLPSLTHDEAAAVADADAELQDRPVHVAASDGASGAPTNEVEMRGSDYETPANEEQVRGNIDGHVAEIEPFNLEVAGADEGEHVSSSGSAGKEKLEAQRQRRIRVLPPSFSQVRRSVMQRSRRASPHTSPALTPSPISRKKMKQKKPLRKLASSAIKSSSSSDNFMGKFRKHFLLDSPNINVVSHL